MTEFKFKEKVYILEHKTGECGCHKCVFNEMGAEGAEACREAPECGTGFYVEQKDGTN